MTWWDPFQPWACCSQKPQGGSLARELSPYLREPSPDFAERRGQGTCLGLPDSWWEDRSPLPRPRPSPLIWTGKDSPVWGREGDSTFGKEGEAGEAAISASRQEAAESCDPQKGPVHVWLFSTFKSTVLGNAGFGWPRPECNLKAFVTLWFGTGSGHGEGKTLEPVSTRSSCPASGRGKQPPSLRHCTQPRNLKGTSREERTMEGKSILGHRGPSLAWM